MTIRFRTAAVLAVGVLMLGAFAACSSGGDGAGVAVPTADVPSSTLPMPGPSTTNPPTSTPNKPGVDPTKGKSVTLTGTIEAGVESGCLVLKTNGKVYSLFGGDQSVLAAGKRVEVTGHETPDIMSFCQQGTPFQVESARAL